MAYSIGLVGTHAAHLRNRTARANRLRFRVSRILRTASAPDRQLSRQHDVAKHPLPTLIAWMNLGVSSKCKNGNRKSAPAASRETFKLWRVSSTSNRRVLERRAGGRSGGPKSDPRIPRLILRIRSCFGATGDYTSRPLRSSAARTNSSVPQRLTKGGVVEQRQEVAEILFVVTRFVGIWLVSDPALR